MKRWFIFWVMVAIAALGALMVFLFAKGGNALDPPNCWVVVGIVSCYCFSWGMVLKTWPPDPKPSPS